MIYVNDKFEIEWQEGMTVQQMLERLNFSFPLIIVSIDGQPLRSEQDLLYYLDTETVVGQTVELAIYRDGQPQTLEVALEARPRPQYSLEFSLQGRRFSIELYEPRYDPRWIENLPQVLHPGQVSVLAMRENLLGVRMGLAVERAGRR